MGGVVAPPPDGSWAFGLAPCRPVCGLSPSASKPSNRRPRRVLPHAPTLRACSPSEGAEPPDEGAAASTPAPAAAERWLRQGKPPPVMVKVSDPGLGATLAAVQVWRQQMELVGAVAEAVEAAGALQEPAAAPVGGAAPDVP